MFLLFEAGGENLILGLITEPLEILIFGVVLILLAVGLRSILKRGEKRADSDMVHKTK